MVELQTLSYIHYSDSMWLWAHTPLEILRLHVVQVSGTIVRFSIPPLCSCSLGLSIHTRIHVWPTCQHLPLHWQRLLLFRCLQCGQFRRSNAERRGLESLSVHSWLVGHMYFRGYFLISFFMRQELRTRVGWKTWRKNAEATLLHWEREIKPDTTGSVLLRSQCRQGTDL